MNDKTSFIRRLASFHGICPYEDCKCEYLEEATALVTSEELPPQENEPEMQQNIDLSTRLERYAIVDLHHDLGESLGKYGAVCHRGRTLDTTWEFMTGIDQLRSSSEFDHHELGTVARHLDRLVKKIPGSMVEVHIRVYSYGTLPTDHEQHQLMNEPKGVANED